MSSVDFSHIKSRHLRSTLEELSPDFELYKSRLDHMNADIKSIEEYLRQRGLILRHEVCILCAEEDPRKVNNPKEEVTGRYTERLVWDRSSDSQTFRLFYRLEVPLDFIGLDDDQGEFRPLLETRVSSRIRAYRKIPELLRELSQLAVAADLDGAQNQAEIDDLFASPDDDLFGPPTITTTVVRKKGLRSTDKSPF